MSRIIVITLAIFICSCGRNTGLKQIDSLVKTREIRIVSSPDSIITKISDIATDIEYFPLKLSASNKTIVIDKIISQGNKIYINSVSNIFCFDSHGNFLYKLYGNKKDNEENVVAIYDFDINKSDSSLIILYGNKLLLFKDTGSGFDYIKTIKLGRLSPAILNFVPGSSKILLSSDRHYGFEQALHVLIDLNGDTLSFKRNYFNRFNPVKSRVWDMMIHYQFNNKLYVRERLNDTVYSLNSQSDIFTPEYILNSRLSSTNSENINNPEYFKILPNVVKIFEVTRYLYYCYPFSKDQYYKIFYDKYENRKYQIKLENGVLKDDIGGGPDFDPKFCSEGKMYSWIDAGELKQYVGNEDFSEAKVQNPQRQEDLKKLVLSIKDTDNPILISVKLKN